MSKYWKVFLKGNKEVDHKIKVFPIKFIIIKLFFLFKKFYHTLGGLINAIFVCFLKMNIYKSNLY